MATTISIVCPECGKQVKAPENVLGKKVRCKFCQAAFVASSGASKPPAGKSGKPAAGKSGKVTPPPKAVAKPADTKPAKKPVMDDDDDDPNPYVMTNVNLAPRCPNCANEMESEDAIICLICGYNTSTREQFQTRKVHALTFGEHFMWLLPGIGCALAVLSALGFDVWYLLKIDDLVGPVEKEFFWGILSHGGIKLWVVIMSLFVTYFAGKFAIKRLILHPKPPEVEKKK